MTLEQLVEEFAQNVTAQSDAILQGDPETGNKHADRYIDAFRASPPASACCSSTTPGRARWRPCASCACSARHGCWRWPPRRRRLRGGACWRLLRAGDSEVLAWDGARGMAAAVAARLER